MHFYRDVNSSRHMIQAYEESFIQVDNQRITHSCIISTHRIIVPWYVKNIAQLKEEDFHGILTSKPIILLLGTGKSLQFPKEKLFLHSEKVSIEIMTTAAACRTYNVLSIEGREVAAAFVF